MGKDNGKAKLGGRTKQPFQVCQSVSLARSLEDDFCTLIDPKKSRRRGRRREEERRGEERKTRRERDREREEAGRRG